MMEHLLLKYPQNFYMTPLYLGSYILGYSVI